ncbi:MAG: ATPase synthesis protein 25 mitochondrial [Sclerophora amabilis]|nr:MAG: ATPase synthesis protein 25 mitochondrial [Sclerophora amabilis]
MVFARAILEGSRCHGCRNSILRSFLSISNPPTRQVHRNNISQTNLTLRSGHLRKHLSTWSFTQSDSNTARDDATHDPQEREDSVASTRSPHEDVSETFDIEPVPWYLQSQSEVSTKSLSERQGLPGLPEDSPNILEPVLEHMSINLGIDDIRLFDLRKLHPPAALGANLIMLIGTARSEKHLHVCADRLCRWGRTTYDLNPFADGLLGRNELKLKMKRKARRAKLLGKVGAKGSDNADDGIRTGWVCVNMGIVQENVTERDDANQPHFIGFGKLSGGVRIVVQLLTDQKRVELDLESLWNNVLAGTDKQDAANIEDAKAEIQDHQDKIGKGRILSPRESFPSSSSFSSLPPSLSPPHIRGVHTSSRSCSPDSTKDTARSPVDVSTACTMDNPSSIAEVDRIKLRQDIPLSSVNNGTSKVLRSQPSNLLSSDFTSSEQKALSLRSDLKYLKSLPRDKALELLGNGGEDFTSTSFLFSFYQTFPTFPDCEHWECRIELYCYAIHLAHPGYHKAHLLQLLLRMETSVTSVSETVFLSILRAVTVRPSSRLLRRNHHQITSKVSSANIGIAMEILARMGKWGHKVLSEEVFMIIHDAIGFHEPIMNPDVQLAIHESDQIPDRKSSKSLRQVQETQRRLNTLMEHFDIHFTSDENIMRMMSLYANQGHWEAFWDLWTMPARRMIPRSATLYAFLFHVIENTKHQVSCMQVLRTWVPEMGREEPRVELNGEVARAVMACTKIADPGVDDRARTTSTVLGEWVRLWKRCEANIDE